MRATAAFVLLLSLAAPVVATTCITVPIDVRRAELVAAARYAGNRTFVVESILRTPGNRPSTLVMPEDWLSSPCATGEPIAGQAYLVARFPTGRFAFAAFEKTAAERALIERLHTVTAPEILEALKGYSRGDASREELEDWLLSALVDAAEEDSFTAELLTAAESLVSRIRLSEACHRELIRSIRTDELPRAAGAIEDILPEVDSEAAFVAKRLEGITDPKLRVAREDEALDAWEETLDAVSAAMDPLEATLRALPWCDHEKYGW